MCPRTGTGGQQAQDSEDACLCLSSVSFFLSGLFPGPLSLQGTLKNRRDETDL